MKISDVLLWILLGLLTGTNIFMLQCGLRMAELVDEMTEDYIKNQRQFKSILDSYKEDAIPVETDSEI